MKILKYILLALTILNIPSVMLSFGNSGLGTASSTLLFGLLVVYIFLNKEVYKPNIWMLLIGVSYFTISSLQLTYFSFRNEDKYYYFTFIKFIILVLSGNILVRKVSDFELFIFLLIGSFSVIIHGVFFPDLFGRYSGLYLNPNSAGFIAIMGYALTYEIKNKYFKAIVQIILTIAGIFTFSRTFLIIWLIINLLSLKISIKNIKILAAGVTLLIALITFGELFNLDSIRLKEFSSILNNQKGSLEKANKDSRTETWAAYYDSILESPFIGNGYTTFSVYSRNKPGVHNSFLLVIGESGIIPFILFTSLYLYIFIWGLKLFKIAPNILMTSIALILYLLTNHNFFTTDSIIILTLWVHYQISEKRKLLSKAY